MRERGMMLRKVRQPQEMVLLGIISKTLGVMRKVCEQDQQEDFQHF